MNNLSIITVNYNDKKGLQDTYRSLVAQSAMNFEWVVVDGRSSDGSVEFIEELARKTTLAHVTFVSERDKGIYDAMNKGINLAHGRYALFLNAGDTLYSHETIAELIKAIKEYTEDKKCKSPILYGGYNRVMPGGRLLPSKVRSPSYIWHSLPTSHQSMLYPMTFLKENPYDLSYRISSDYYITCLAYRLGYPFQKLNLNISNFKTGGTASQNSGRAIRDAARIQREILQLSWPMILLSMIRRYVNINIVNILHQGKFGSRVFFNLIARVQGKGKTIKGN